MEPLLRLLLWKHFDGQIVLERVLPGGDCLLRHDDGSRGVVPTLAIMGLEPRAHFQIKGRRA